MTLRDHKGTLSDLSDAEWQEYTRIVKRLENAYKVGLGAILSNWTCLMNNAYQEKPSLPHVHWHVRPRYEKSISLNGIEFNDPDFGFHYDRAQKQSVDNPTFQIIVARIKANL